MLKRILIVGIAIWGMGVNAQSNRVDLLLVDETQTFQGSLMVQVYARVLQETGLFNFEAKVVTVQSSYDDPLRVNTSDKKYELILIVPKGIEDGSVNSIWMITRSITPQTRPELLSAMQLIRQRVAQDSGGLFRALGVMDDAALGIFSTVFERHGWLR